MKLFLLVVATSLFTTAHAANYYFSSSTGDDSRSNIQVQNPATPWKTINKLNSFFSNVKAGDSILFRSGETFYGSIHVTKSGTISRSVVFSSYGTGARPVISGFTTLSSWSSLGGGLYQSKCASCKVTDNLLTLNGVSQAIGRYPNSGYLSYESYAGTNSITDKQLTKTPNWTGADVVVRKSHWTLERSPIASHSGNTINFKTSSVASSTNGYGYFIQNDQRTLDKLGEWYLQPVSKNMMVYFGNNNPAQYTIKTSTIDTLVYISYQNYISFYNLSFQGANISAFDLLASNNISIESCSIDFSGTNAITAWSSPNLRIERSKIDHTNNNAIGLYWGGTTHTLIRYDTIKNTGMIAGMGANDDNSYDAVVSNCAATLIEFSEIDSTGHSPIRFLSDSVIVKNNLINYFALTKDDAGGVYVSQRPTDPIYYGRKITGNIILNGTGASEGTEGYLATEGIYMDAWVKNVEISSNTISKCSHGGIFIQSAQELSVKDNTVFDNDVQLLMNNAAEPSRILKNVAVKNNILFAKTAAQLTLSFVTSANNISEFGTADSNYYARPLGDNYSLSTSAPGDAWTGVNKNLSQWQKEYGKDVHSKASPKTFSGYTMNNLLGSDKYNNGSFTSNVNGLYCWSASGHCITVWDGSNKMDAGSLKLSYSSKANDNSFVIIGIGAVSSTKNYILKYSVLGTKSGRIATYLKQSNSPFHDITPVNYSSLNTVRTEREILFASPTSENNASIVFQANDVDSTCWLDNIRLYEADVTIKKPDEYIRFEYNAANTNKRITLDRAYVDVDGVLYSQYVILKPYTSIVLLSNDAYNSQSQKTLSFEANKNENAIDLNWKISNDTSVSFFDIQRSADGINFKSVGYLRSAKAGSPYKYVFSDLSPLTGKNYYRIKQVENDTRHSYSEIVLVQNLYSAKLNISPNPAGDKLKVSYQVPVNSKKVNLLIENISGGAIKNITCQNSSDMITVDISSLVPGTYLVTIVYDDFVITKRFVKAKY